MKEKPKNLAFSKPMILDWTGIFLILVISFLPLFMKFHYRINIYLSWEGAYRLYLGQTPYRDFGMPLGFGYWIVPALFFKIFGPYMISLIKAQVFLNLLGAFSFRSILKSVKTEPAIRLFSILIFCISYTFLNFWPWYNNTVIIYELLGIAFLLSLFTKPNFNIFNIKFILASLFIFLSFFTKQDAGFLGFLVGLGLVIYYSIINKRFTLILFYLIYVFIFGIIFFLPFSSQGIGYWFNHGQAPHSSRISIYDILDGLLNQSSFIKLYFLLILLLSINEYNRIRSLDKTQQKELLLNEGLFLILVVGILFEAIIFQVTSYVPKDNNIFFHSFAFAFILSFIPIRLKWENNLILIPTIIAIGFWWSSIFWEFGFVQGIVSKFKKEVPDSVVTINSYKIIHKSPYEVPANTWKESKLKSFKRILMPVSTLEGIDRILQLPEVKKPGMSLLNMTELTPLEYELGSKLETGKNIPLWYHRGVGMFKNQTEEYCNKIRDQKYDLVLFEYIPTLNNFYPFRIKDTLNKYYQIIDSFKAPRDPIEYSFIEVYRKKPKIDLEHFKKKFIK